MTNRHRGEFTTWNASLQASSGRQLLALGVALLVAWLFVMAVVGDASAGDDLANLAANPELAAAGRWAFSQSPSTAAAANPELAAAGRWAFSGSRGTAAAANPELAAAGLWAFSGSRGTAAAANPELAAAGLWAFSGSRGTAAAANPELAAASRYSGLASSTALTFRSAAGGQNDSSFMAANPEVMTAHRYSRPVSECGIALGC